ncbi:hypothetical protein IFR05_007309 [Cadophora sp. M221]|nr:hypothetical protein IFR05_007309 [Cadophora sp. M221]
MGALISRITSRGVDLEVFSPERFLEDTKRTAEAIGAPYSEAATKAVLEAYAQSFKDGAVLWRATNRPGDALNFRFYERRPVDTVSIAVKAGFIEKDNIMGTLITSWSSLYTGDGTPEQSCDFDAGTGLTKAWVYMGGMRPIDDILNAEHVPESLKKHGPTFHGLGLELVRHVAVDYYSGTVNIYFRAPGPLNVEQASRFVALADCPPLPEAEVMEMRKFLNPTGFTFAVTIKLSTGSISRVGFYALKLPIGSFPEIGSRLATFFSTAPSHDTEEMNAIAWSFGPGGKRYIKAERSYCGRLVPLLRDW